MSKHRYRKISTRIWGDANFRSFSNEGKLVWFFVLTHPQMTSMGAMRTTIPGLAAELGWTEKAFREAFREPLSKGMLKVDEKASLLVVPKFLFHNAPESPNVVTSWSSQYEVLPECQLLTVYLQEVKGFVEGLGEGFRKAFAIPLSKGMPYPELQPELQPEPDIPPIPLKGVETVKSDKFGRFWESYPKKINKGDAEKAWKTGKCDKHLDAILQSLEKHKVWQDWTKDGGKFIPHPATWLRRLGWEDDLEITGIDAPTSPTTPLSQLEPIRDKQITHRGFTAAYSVQNGKVDHFLVSNGGNSWRIPSGLTVDEAVSAIREQIDGKIEGLKL